MSLMQTKSEGRDPLTNIDVAQRLPTCVQGILCAFCNIIGLVMAS